MEGNALRCPLLEKLFGGLKYQKSRTRCQNSKHLTLAVRQHVSQTIRFSDVCLDMWVLQTTANQIRHTHGQSAIARAGPTHKYVTSRPLSAFCKLHFALSHHTVGNTATLRTDKSLHQSTH